MEENNNVGEQPSFQDFPQPQGAHPEEIMVEKEMDGSPIGKFKDAGALLMAYNSLEAEFTRKSQRLSEIEKQIRENEDKSGISPETPRASLPEFEKEDWAEKVAKFVTENEQAKPYAKEISREIVSNPDAYKGENALEIAFSKIVLKKFSPPEVLASNDEFLAEHVLSNKTAKEKVLKLYLDSLSKNKAAPVLTSVAGSHAPLFRKEAPKNLDEAKRRVSELFNT